MFKPPVKLKIEQPFLSHYNPSHSRKEGHMYCAYIMDPARPFSSFSTGKKINILLQLELFNLGAKAAVRGLRDTYYARE
jgi:hypothetical protein